MRNGANDSSRIPQLVLIYRAYRVLERGARGVIVLPLVAKPPNPTHDDARVRASPRAQLSSCVARRRGRLPRALWRSHRCLASILVHVSLECRELAFTPSAPTCMLFLECKSRRVIFVTLIVYWHVLSSINNDWLNDMKCLLILGKQKFRCYHI